MLAATKYLIRKLSRMIIKAIREKIEAVKLSATISKRKTYDIQKYNVKMIEKTLNTDIIMNITRTLGFGIKRLYALKDEQGQIANTRDEVIMIMGEILLQIV